MFSKCNQMAFLAREQRFQLDDRGGLGKERASFIRRISISIRKLFVTEIRSVVIAKLRTNSP